MKKRITSKVRFMRGASVTVLSLAAVMGSTPAAMTAGNISNTPTVNGTAGGVPVTVTGTQVDVPIEDKAPKIVALKSASLGDDDSSGGASVGDTITYTISVQNDGNVTLANVALNDTLTNGDTTGLAYTSGPTLTGGDGGVAGDLEVGETWTYTATYQLTQDDIDSGSINNVLVVDAEDPQGATVSDTADDPTDPTTTDTPTTTGDDPTVTTLAPTTGLEVSKSDSIALGGDGIASAGDVVSYVIQAVNTGNVALSAVTPVDTLTNGSGTTTLTLVGPSGDTDGDGKLDPDETWEWTTTYTLTQADVTAGSISNSVFIDSLDPSNNAVSDTSDDPDEPGLTGNDDPTVTPLPAAPSLTIDKTFVANNGTPVGVGDVITYTYTVTNTGNVFVNGITISDVHNGTPLLSSAGPDSSTVPFDEASTGTNSTDAVVDGIFDSLAPGEQATFTFQYTVTQADVDGQI